MKPPELSREQHAELAQLLKDATAKVNESTKIVGRADYTDRTLQAMRVIQELLIDPLYDGWETQFWTERDNPYPKVGYYAHWPRKPR